MTPPICCVNHLSFIFLAHCSGGNQGFRYLSSFGTQVHLHIQSSHSLAFGEGDVFTPHFFLHLQSQDFCQSYKTGKDFGRKYLFHSGHAIWSLGRVLVCLGMKLAERIGLQENGRCPGEQKVRQPTCVLKHSYTSRDVLELTITHASSPSSALLGRPYPLASTPTGPWLALSGANGLPRSPPVSYQSWLCIANASTLADHQCNAAMRSITSASAGPQVPALKSVPQLLAPDPPLLRGIGHLNIKKF